MGKIFVRKIEFFRRCENLLIAKFIDCSGRAPDASECLLMQCGFIGIPLIFGFASTSSCSANDSIFKFN